jgi:ABC-type phosphate/phosphonate transport system ATPase subunit
MQKPEVILADEPIASLDRALAQLDQLRTFFGFFAILFVVKSRVSIAKL